MLQRYVSRPSIFALAAAAALGVSAVSLWGAEPATPERKQITKAESAAAQGTQLSATSGDKSSTSVKLSGTARGVRIPESNGAVRSRLAVAAVATSPSGGWHAEAIPETLRDPGFDRYIDLALLCKAWDEKNASALADVALQLREGERILLRSHRGFSSQQLLQESARIAAESKDKAALQRLAKIAESIGCAELKAKLAGAEKLADEARANDPALQVSIAEMTPEVYAELWEYVHAARGASLTGDMTTLKQMQDELATNPEIPAKQKKYLVKLLQESQATAATLPESQKQLGQALDKLSDSSRRGGGGGHGGGGHGGGGGRRFGGVVYRRPQIVYVPQQPVYVQPVYDDSQQSNDDSPQPSNDSNDSNDSGDGSQ
jgi:hypothetical protein